MHLSAHEHLCKSRCCRSASHCATGAISPTSFGRATKVLRNCSPASQIRPCRTSTASGFYTVHTLPWKHCAKFSILEETMCIHLQACGRTDRFNNIIHTVNRLGLQILAQRTSKASCAQLLFERQIRPPHIHRSQHGVSILRTAHLTHGGRMYTLVRVKN